MVSEISSLTRLQAADDTQQWSGEVRSSHGAEIDSKIINHPRQGDRGRNKQYVAQNPHSALLSSLPYSIIVSDRTVNDLALRASVTRTYQGALS
jgi:hypothetical protein